MENKKYTIIKISNDLINKNKITLNINELIINIDTNKNELIIENNK